MSNAELDDKTLARLIHATLDILKDYGYFTECLWHVNDIHLICQQRGWPLLNHQEAKAVFAIFAELYDGEAGMTWPKLEQATQVYLAQQGKVRKMDAPRHLSAEAIQDLIEGEMAEDLSHRLALPSEKWTSKHHPEKFSTKAL